MKVDDGPDRWAPPFSRQERGRRWSGPAGKKWAASSTGPSRAGGKKNKGGEGRWAAGKKGKEGGEWAAWARWGWMGFGVWVRFVFFFKPF
jgi:hypothetical protein